MKKITAICALFLGLASFTYAQDNYGQVKFDFDEKHDFAAGGVFNKVSNNGKYVVGYSDNTYNAFYYDVEKGTLTNLNPENETFAANPEYLASTAYDVSDKGIIVGTHSFEKLVTVPAYYMVSKGEWFSLPLSLEAAPESSDQNGIATSISADGKFISGYILSKLDNSKISKEVILYAPCLWVNKGTDENPNYELQLPIEDDHTKIVTQGDFPFQMSDDGKYLGGHHTNESGCFNPSIWTNEGAGKPFSRTNLVGKESVEYDEEGGALPGQYFWAGTVSSISPNGEWVVGYHNFNGGFIADDVAGEPAQVGFKYNTVTKEFSDSLFGGLPAFVFDDGDIIFGQSAENESTNMNIMSSSIDKKVMAGVVMEMVPGLGKTNYPYLKIQGYVANEIVKADLDVNVFVNDKNLYVDGEFTSVEVYSVLGSRIATFNNEVREINLSNLNNGVYMVRVINGNQFTTKKINL